MSQQFLQRGDVTLSYERHGAATSHPALLLTHGFGSNTTMWSPNVAALSADRLVLTWDLRGHGRTTAPYEPELFTPEACVGDMVALLDDSGVEGALIGGLSLGGYLSLCFALAHPSRTVGLVLCDTGPGFSDATRREAWNHYALAQAESFEVSGADAVASRTESLLGPRDPRGLAEAARGILVQSDDAVISSLGTIRVPTLIVVGEDDGPFLAAATYMARKIPDARHEVIANAAHASNIDQPDTFNALVGDFMAHLT